MVATTSALSSSVLSASVESTSYARTSPWPPPIPSTSTQYPPLVDVDEELQQPSTTRPSSPALSQASKPRRKGLGNGGGTKSKGKGKKSTTTKRLQQQQQVRLDEDAATATNTSHDEALDASIKTCEAIDRWDERCTEVVVGGHKGKVNRDWCHVHEVEEHQVRQEFLRCISALPGASKHLPLPDASDITSCEDLDELEDWEKIARQHAAMSDKAIACRDYHLRHFPAASDLAHLMGRMSLEELTLRSRAADGVMRLVTRRSHLLILTSEDALWLLEPSPPAPPPCLSNSPNPLRPPCAPSLQTEAEEPDPVVALERVRRAELLELLSLTGSHASFIRNSTKSVQRVRVIECLFRRLISRDEELLVKAYRGGHDHVLRFFEDTSCCSLASLTRLHTALQQTSSLALKEAIMDAFRAIAWEESGAGETEDGEEGLGLQLLGGWSYKIQLARSMTPIEWSHLYDLCGCPGCALRCCMRFTDWAYIRRLSVVSSGRPGSTPPFEHWADSPNESDAARIFKALSVVRCSESGPGASEAEIRRVGGGFVGAKGKGMWVERIERNWMFVKLAFDEPQSRILLFALSQHHTLVVRTNSSFPDDGGFPPPPSSHLWYSRHRSASSKPLLRHQPWSIDLNAFGSNNSDPLSSLDQLDSPETAQSMPSFPDTFEVLILDGHGRDGAGTGRTAGESQNRSFEQFEAELGQALCDVLGVEDVRGAIRHARERGLEKGEFVDWGGGGEGLPLEEHGLGALEKKKKAVAKNASIGNGGGAALESLRDDALALKLSRSLFR